MKLSADQIAVIAKKCEETCAHFNVKHQEDKEWKEYLKTLLISHHGTGGKEPRIPFYMDEEVTLWVQHFMEYFS